MVLEKSTEETGSFNIKVNNVMKTTSKIYVAIATILIPLTMVATTNAMNGYWGWSWQWMTSWWNWQQINKQNHTPWDLISSIATWSLTEQEEQDLYYQYNEEKVARDLYTYFYSLYWVQTFQTIATSEQQHMDSVKVLLDRYNLETPTTYGELETTFNTLKAEWELWLKEAFEAWIKVEILDVTDIVDTIKSTDNDDIKVILTNIWGASYNHLRGFVKALLNNWFTTTIDYSAYLTQDDLNAKWSLQYKLSEVLESQWVELPDLSSSNYIKNNCIYNCQYNYWLSWQYQNSLNQNRYQSFNKNKNLYKSQIQVKYWNMLKNMNQNKLNALDWKLDKVIESVENNQTMTQITKDKYLSLYYALKEYLGELVK